MTNQEICMRLAKSYHCKSTDQMDLDNVDMTKISPYTSGDSSFPWFMVGHNSSHQFFLGVDERGNLYKRSLGYDYDIDPSMSEEEYNRLASSPNKEDREKARDALKMVLETKVTQVVFPNLGYLGHF